MDKWALLNDLRRDVYLGSGSLPSEKLALLVIEASKSDDAGFIESVVQLKEDSNAINAKRKLLWLTSKVHDTFYPPLPISLAGPLPWNANIILRSSSDSVNSKYCLREKLVNNPDMKYSLQQCKDIENCSFVASLIICRNSRANLPVVKKAGPDLYHVNLLFNGSKDRLVTVDISSVPTDTERRQLSVMSNNIDDKIIEQAYLQVIAGSYDCEGSNCAIDTFLLTGFAPEVVKPKKYSIKKLIDLFQSGLCLIAIGTGDDSSKLDSPFIKNHDYPILDVDKESSSILLGDTLDSERRISIGDESLHKYFSQIYLLWETPKLFSVTKTLHFYYNSDKANQFRSVTDKPRFILKNESNTPASVWLLLETNLPSHTECTKKGAVAYLKEVPDNFFFGLRGSPEGACDIGLQLLKLTVPPKVTTRFFCHSSENAHLTIHTLTNTSMVALRRDAGAGSLASLKYSVNDPQQYTLDSFNYFRNPTFRLRITCAITKEIPVHLRLLSEDPRDLINLEVFHLSDHSLSKPLLRDTDYTHQKYDKLHTPLITNTEYKVICSTYSQPSSRHFKLVLAPATPEPSNHIKFDLEQVFLEHGGYNHKIETRLEWPENSNKLNVRLQTNTNNRCFFRIVPNIQSSMLFVRCNIFDLDTHHKICGDKTFRKPSAGGIVVDEVEICGHPNVALLIEKDEAISPNRICKAVPFTLIIGSQNRITLI